MKVEELQIGDWVAIGEPDNFHGYTGKVISINGNTNYVTVFIPCHHDHDVLVDDLSPIPLTPEILKNNGFDLDKEDKRYYRIDSTVLLCFEARHACLETRIMGCFGYLYEVFCYCDSVHELQHAIRLLNIDKEIII